MTAHRNGYTRIDEAVSAEVRAEIARSRDVTVSSIASHLDMRRATLSSRVNGHAAFTTSLLAAVAHELGTTAAAIVARAEAEITAQADGHASAPSITPRAA